MVHTFRVVPSGHTVVSGDKVEVKVKFYALNFRDLFAILKPIEGIEEAFPFAGLDFAGIVTAIGDGVKDLKIGDQVFG